MLAGGLSGLGTHATIQRLSLRGCEQSPKDDGMKGFPARSR